MVWLFAVTLFTSATLLFWVQPMFAKMILPLLGGTPGVWNASMVFFQAVLLAGYGYAHLVARLPLRRQAIVHGALLASAFVSLPIGVARGWTPPESSNPVLWVLLLLAVSVGLPALVISSTAPLLQNWFSHSDHPHARDPYFLYSSSNAGSIAALVAYPTVIEPTLRLAGQSRAWTAGYALLALLIAACVAAVVRRPAAAPEPAAEIPPVPPAEGKRRRRKRRRAAGTAEPAAPVVAAAGPPWALRLRWFALAAVPSSLLLGVTTHITTDIAAIPLFWVVPLVLYLLTYVIAFARRPLPHRLVVAAHPFVVLPLVALFALRLDTAVAGFPLHLAAFFVSALLCHGELARRRPATTHLTDFYLWMSLGGVAGGLFNSILAPLLFPRVWEYPLAFVLVFLLRPAGGSGEGAGRRARVLDYAIPAALGAAALAVVKLLPEAADYATSMTARKVFVLAAAAGIWLLRKRPLRFGLAAAALVATGIFAVGRAGETLLLERNFFGVIDISRDSGGRFHTFTHGHTVHGAQSLDPARRREPLTYFTRSGPLGQVFAALGPRLARARIAVIGLGAGSIAAYGRPGQHITYYEIDPDVERVARDPALFTFLADSAADVDVVIGDARLTLGREADASFDLLVLDAFSSDAIPMHLITREALALYAAKLAPGGAIVCNISNRYLDLVPVLANLARDRGWTCIVKRDLAPTIVDEIRDMRSRSTWAVLGPGMNELGPVALSGGWQLTVPKEDDRVWTDDYSPILTALRVSWPWRRRGGAAPAGRAGVPRGVPPAGIPGHP